MSNSRAGNLSSCSLAIRSLYVPSGAGSAAAVVDVLAEDVYAAGTPCHELGGMAVAGLELGEQLRPPLALMGHARFGIDVLEGLGDRDRAGHFGEGSCSYI